jgi:hypothetical protein
MRNRSRRGACSVKAEAGMPELELPTTASSRINAPMASETARFSSTRSNTDS